MLLYVFQEGWCDIQGTLEEVRVKLQKRQEGAIKRERAIAYAYSQQVEGAAKCNVGIINTLLYEPAGVLWILIVTFLFLFYSLRSLLVMAG